MAKTVRSDNYWLSNATNAAVVTPSDSADLSTPALRGLYVGGTGHISLITTGGDTVLVSAVPIGTILPIQVARVRSTGTTATLIVALS